MFSWDATDKQFSNQIIWKCFILFISLHLRSMGMYLNGSDKLCNKQMCLICFTCICKTNWGLNFKVIPINSLGRTEELNTMRFVVNNILSEEFFWRLIQTTYPLMKEIAHGWSVEGVWYLLMATLLYSTWIALHIPVLSNWIPRSNRKINLVPLGGLLSSNLFSTFIAPSVRWPLRDSYSD